MQCDVALIESSAQLNCMVSYLKARDGGAGVVLFARLNGVPKNDNEIVRVAELNKKYFSGVNYFKANRNSISSVLFGLVFFVLSKSFLFRVGHVFVGDHNSRWMNLYRLIVCCRGVYYLDDGLASVDNYRAANASGRKCNLVTFLDLPSTEVVNVVRLYMPSRTLVPQSTDVWIVGMPVLEMMAFKDPSMYELYICDVVKYFADQYRGSRVIYFPHRYEDGKVDDFLRAAGVDVCRVRLSLESYIDAEGCAPFAIVSLYSTALIYIPLCFPQVKVFSYRVPTEYISPGFSRAADAAYWYLERSQSVIMLRAVSVD